MITRMTTRRLRRLGRARSARLSSLAAGGEAGALLVARHGERLDDIDQSWSFGAEYPLDPPLSGRGCVEAEQMALRLRDHGVEVHHIFASPLRRCLHTAQVVALTLGRHVTFKVEVGLQETPRRLWPHLQGGGEPTARAAAEGAAEGAPPLGTAEDLRAIELVHDMPAVVGEFSRMDYTYPSQFDMITVEAGREATYDRAERVMRKLRASFPDGNLLLITHHSVARGGVLRLANLSPEERADIEAATVPSCGVTTLAPPPGGFDPERDLLELEHLWDKAPPKK